MALKTVLAWQCHAQTIGAYNSLRMEIFWTHRLCRVALDDAPQNASTLLGRQEVSAAATQVLAVDEQTTKTRATLALQQEDIRTDHQQTKCPQSWFLTHCHWTATNGRTTNRQQHKGDKALDTPITRVVSFLTEGQRCGWYLIINGCVRRPGHTKSRNEKWETETKKRGNRKWRKWI